MNLIELFSCNEKSCEFISIILPTGINLEEAEAGTLISLLRFLVQISATLGLPLLPWRPFITVTTMHTTCSIARVY